LLDRNRVHENGIAANASPRNWFRGHLS